MTACLQQIRMLERHTSEGVAGADLGNRALIAIDTAVVAHLQKHGAVAKSIAPLYAFSAANAQMLVDHVFVIRIFDICPLDCCRRAQLVFRSCIEIVRLRLKIAGAKLAIAAQRIRVNTLHC